MTQAKNANLRKFKNLVESFTRPAGQKTRIGWQGLPGAVAMEAVQCR